jgi:hypothetical protein
MSCPCQSNSIFSETKNGFLCYVCTACKRVKPEEHVRNYTKCSCGDLDYEKWKFDFNREYIICGACNQVLIL